MQKLSFEKGCIFISRFIGKIILVSFLAVLMAIPLSVSAMCVSFRAPNQRLLINNSYAGIHFVSRDDSHYVPARRVFEYLGAKVSWCDEYFLGIEYDGQNHAPGFFLRNDRSYVAVDVVSQIVGERYIEFLACVNALKISKYPSSLTPNCLVQLLPSFYNYSEEDLHWMARIIHAEARGEPFESMLAVGNVVLNRKARPEYPDTVRGVIFDRNHGVQFSPTANGAINNTPSTASFLAALEVLEGRQNAEGVLFFKNPRITGPSWMSRNRPFAFTIANQDFFF